jgi:16S rRNA processing protein RimM
MSRTRGFIAIAHVARSHGTQGELRVQPLTHSPERFNTLENVWIGTTDAEARKFEVERVRRSGCHVILKLSSVDTRSDADRLRNQFVFVQEQDAVPPPRGSYFVHEVIGLDVRTDEGKTVGQIVDVLTLPANDAWVVRTNGTDVLIPAVKAIIKDVDLKRRTVVIHALEGLFE